MLRESANAGLAVGTLKACGWNRPVLFGYTEASQFIKLWRSNRMAEAKFTIEEVNDPADITRSQAQHERAVRNSRWLESHWPDVLPQARGKFLAVAGQEAFIGNSPEEAWAWAAAAHPDDDGALVQYVYPTTGPRIYAHRGNLAAVR